MNFILSLASQLVVGNAFADNACNGDAETFGVRQLTIVKSVGLFIEVAEEVERLNTDVSSVNAPLQQAPEVLHRVRVHSTST